jgi:hypothetical protein
MERTYSYYRIPPVCVVMIIEPTGENFIPIDFVKLVYDTQHLLFALELSCLPFAKLCWILYNP